MLGVLLPTLSQRWGLRDDAAGFLLFLQFLGSSLGALFVGARRVRTLIAGYGLLAACACALAFAGMHLSFAIFFFFGLGLGMTMTSTSLLFSDRYPDNRAAKLERLNFAWAAGATAAPVLFLPLLRLRSLDPLFFTLQALCLLLFAWVTLREREEPSHAGGNASRQESRATVGFLLPLLLMAMCSVGIEASLSGWLTTYAHRADSEGVGGAALASSLFWFGIVVSRLAFSTRLLELVGRRRLFHAILWGVAACLVLLVAAYHPAPIRVAALLTGLCIGPLYPLLLSFILQRFSHGWIFAVPGIGSALLPWITGLFSAHFGSLHYGLIAPCGAALLMVALSFTGLRVGDSALPAAAPHP
jgi:FHS family glucose/mannose:H+ symporter-like MFS transporter